MKITHETKILCSCGQELGVLDINEYQSYVEVFACESCMSNAEEDGHGDGRRDGYSDGYQHGYRDGKDGREPEH